MPQSRTIAESNIQSKVAWMRWGLLIAGFVIVLLSACNNASNQELEIKDSVVVDSFVSPHDSLAPLTTDLFIWSIDFDNWTKIKNPALKPAYLQVDSIIKGLNILYPGIVLQKVGLSADTLYSTIANSEVLTEQMGSSGAAAYIAAAVINLTAVPGVRYVRIDFAEGSHLEPDTWSAEQFKDYIEVR